MPVRLHGRKESTSASPRIVKRNNDAAISIDVVAAQMASADTRARRYDAKEEIGKAINEADRTMSKCHKTLRRLRSKLKF